MLLELEAITVRYGLAQCLLSSGFDDIVLLFGLLRLSRAKAVDDASLSMRRPWSSDMSHINAP